MTYSIVYSSQTGNTKLLADALRAALPAEDCLYFGAPDAAALAADRLYVGFWTDKGSCDSSVAAPLAQVTGQEVFLFGTCGFGGGIAYFEQIIARVRDRYVCIAEEEPAKRSHMQKMIFNFDAALSHPDADDLQGLVEAVKAL